VAPQECVPSHAEKHLKADPSGAQSESREHGREHDFAVGVQPASVKEPSGSQERPAAHSLSAVQEMPAGSRGVPLLLHASTTDSAANARGMATRGTAKG
jgi:hypothetical protein